MSWGDRSFMSEAPAKRPSVLPHDGGTSDPSELVLGIAGYSYADLFEPARLAALNETFEAWFKDTAPDAHKAFDAYRTTKGEGMTPVARSEALLAAAPFVSAFVGKLFNVESELLTLRHGATDRAPLWRFKSEFVKKRVLKDAGKAWRDAGRDRAFAEGVSKCAIATVLPDAKVFDEELRIARAFLLLFDVDDVARKVKKGGGAEWTDALRKRAKEVGAALRGMPGGAALALGATEEDDEKAVAIALDALEAWLAARKADGHDPIALWPSFKMPHNLDYANLVQIRRPSATVPELFVGAEHHAREREGFALTDRRADARAVEEEINYCLYCHDRDKDSCSKGMVDPKTKTLKKNPIGVQLTGCPLEEKISEMHMMRGQGDTLAALALVCIDNPMLPGTGHRICNDCMKACIFQKQEPVNIPQIETRVLTEILAVPWGLEIYGFMTRWNPLNIARPYARAYNGKNVLVVGLGPAGYTLAHHLACEGFGVVAVDGLKIEPLPEALVGRNGSLPRPVRDFSKLYLELDERVLLGFGGVSEYGITARWDKNFLTVLYATLSRSRHVRIYGGVRFGGTLTLDDAWTLGFDHVAIAAGAGKPTIIDMKNNLARGIRKASDFLMALQLGGAYKKSSLANLQVTLPAIVIGGGLTAIDTATELLAYYVVQVEKERERYETLVKNLGAAAVRKLFNDEEWALLEMHVAHAKAIEEERQKAAREDRPPKLQPLLTEWGGVSICYRKTIQDSPAYRLNHEEIIKCLEEGVRFVENVSPDEAVLDERGHVKAVKFIRKNGGMVELPARTVCVAAGTSPNVTYEREYAGTFMLDSKQHYFQAHAVSRDEKGALSVEPTTDTSKGFFTSYLNDGRTVSFYGDNHPHYAGSVVKAMASAKDGYPHVVELFPEIRSLDAKGQGARDAALKTLFAKLDRELKAEVVAVNRLTKTIVEVVVHAPLAARKFQPGQFYRLQNFETFAPILDGSRLAMEGLALTGAWIDEEKGLLGTIVLEMGASSRLCAALKPGEPVVLMGPTGTPTEILAGETVLLCGGGLGNAVLFSIARAFKALGSNVLYFAGYKNGEDVFKQDEIERDSDQIIWTTDAGKTIDPRRPQDHHFRGNIVEAMVAYATGKIGGEPKYPFKNVARIIAIGSDRMMEAVKNARHGQLLPLLNPRHLAIGSINSPMQCMMKEICAQCLQKHIDPVTKMESVVFSCANQDQELDRVDFRHLHERLQANSMQEKLADAWLHHLLEKQPEVLRI
jgi:NADPH-dependent glutamate synthase beta subunit-like oxidoreductase/NAD(P)H-flavin reductase